jgi:hypothetical protein
MYDITYTPKKLTNVANMSWSRWYATPTLLPSGKVMIMGGTQVGGWVGGWRVQETSTAVFSREHPTINSTAMER